MQPSYNPVRTPIRQPHAESYLIITLISFAISVSLTRFTLYITGYPQLGNEELHIAHVLWGGLILFIAALLSLIYVNQWILSLSAALSGLGAGLFIDEVGKFITQTNDYFYPAAAPIIYSSFLMVVLLYILIRRKRNLDAREYLYNILHDLEELLDQDLSEQEMIQIRERLKTAGELTADRGVKKLAQSLYHFIQDEQVVLVPERPNVWSRMISSAARYETDHTTQMQYRLFLSFAMLFWSIWHLLFPTQMIGLINIRFVEEAIARMVASDILRGGFTFYLYLGQVGLQMAVALIILTAAFLFFIRREKPGVMIAYFGFLFSLTVVNLLYIYFDQFSIIPDSFIQFILLLLVIRYRQRFFTEEEPLPVPDEDKQPENDEQVS